MNNATSTATRPDFYTLDHSDVSGDECDCGHEDCLVCLVQSLEGPGPEVVEAAAA